MDAKSIEQIPGYIYNQYQLILKPNEDLCDKIIQVKKEFSEKYKVTKTHFLPPHILLARFVQFEMREPQIINRLKSIASQFHPFKIDLKDYGSLPTHSIFLNVESKQQIQNLLRELKTAQQLMTLNKENKVHFIDHFFITVANKLLPWQYEKGWLDYGNRHFSGGFISQKMMLMKRRIEGGKYKVVKEFELMNLPTVSKQGRLFI